MNGSLKYISAKSATGLAITPENAESIQKKPLKKER